MGPSSLPDMAVGNQNGFNEGWGEGSPSMVNTTMALFRNLSTGAGKHTRNMLLNDASGGRGFGCGAGWVDPDKCTKTHKPGPGGLEPRCMAVFWTGGCQGQADIIDHHHYPEPQVPYDLGSIAKAHGQPFLQNEYGGWSAAVKGHQWNETGCGHVVSGNARAPDELAASQLRLEGAAAVAPGGDTGMTAAYLRYNVIAGSLLSKGLSGQIFTQISDIECELSGFYTYDRKIVKVDLEAVAASNRQLLLNASRLGLHPPPPPPTTTMTTTTTTAAATTAATTPTTTALPLNDFECQVVGGGTYVDDRCYNRCSDLGCYRTWTMVEAGERRFFGLFIPPSQGGAGGGAPAAMPALISMSDGADTCRPNAGSQASARYGYVRV